MIKYLVILALLFDNVVIAQAQSDNTPFLTKSFSNSSFTSAIVRTSGGNITATATEGSEARVEVFIKPGNSREKLSKDEIQQRLDDMYELEIAVSNNKLIAKARSKDKIRNWKKSLSIGFRIFVPKEVETELVTSGGNVSISGLSGKQNLTTSGGNLIIKEMTGMVKGRTSGGNINVNNCSQDLDLATSGGNIEAGNCSGKIRLGTSGGSLFLKELRGDIKATTSGGNINGKHISGELVTSTSGGNIQLKDLACSLDAGTSGGNIHVEMIELGKYITLTNSSGTIGLDLPKGKGVDLQLKAGRITTDRLENFTGEMKEDKIDGKLNGGGVLVKVKAGSGRIVLGLK